MSEQIKIEVKVESGWNYLSNKEQNFCLGVSILLFIGSLILLVLHLRGEL